ncbi:MAG: 16S rRNA (uracil(1498)-N(3))-methyltransferase [Rhizobiaceae bacterium]|nr:16S rRNA (uracil(1498)-N(3))-methyltransferase [Rhizobiaceae bacterium]
MAVHDFRSQRVFVEHDLAANSRFEASREQANYLLNVLRIPDGGSILIFNGRDGEWRAEIEAIGRKKCNLKPTELVRKQTAPYSLRYCFAPLKQGRLDYMVQKAVEMGVGVLQPVITQYTQVRSINESRLRANAIEAAEQCGILNIPDIKPIIPLSELVETMGTSNTLVFCDEERPHVSAINKFESKTDLTLLIGPEGGFSDEERTLIQTSPNVARLGLGPRILRADTAAVAALAILQSSIGDWYPSTNC